MKKIFVITLLVVLIGQINAQYGSSNSNSHKSAGANPDWFGIRAGYSMLTGFVGLEYMTEYGGLCAGWNGPIGLQQSYSLTLSFYNGSSTEDGWYESIGFVLNDAYEGSANSYHNGLGLMLGYRFSGDKWASRMGAGYKWNGYNDFLMVEWIIELNFL